jgi:hypothetical protein
MTAVSKAQGMENARYSDMMIEWRAQPSLIADGNMAAIVITNDEARRQRVHGALSRQPSR